MRRILKMKLVKDIIEFQKMLTLRRFETFHEIKGFSEISLQSF